MAGTWIIRLVPLNTPTGNTDLSDPNAGIVAGTSKSGTVQAPVFASGSAFVYLDGSSSPTTIAGLPTGFAPADAFTLHHISSAVQTGDSVENTIGGLFDQTFVGPNFGMSPPFWTDTPLTGMTLTKFTALFGSHMLATLITGVVPTAQSVCQSTTPFDPDFTIQLRGTYTTAPTLTSLSPNHGSILGGTVVSLVGVGFTGITGLTVGGAAALSVSVSSDTLLTFVTPPHAIGVVDVVVSGATLSGAFAFVCVARVSPKSGTIAGGTAVTVTGFGFAAATMVTFGGVAATHVVVVSQTTITAVTPAHASGAVDVTVVGVATGAHLYTYTLPVPQLQGKGPLLPPIPTRRSV